MTRKAQIQLKVKAIEVPRDLNSGEKSSTFMVQARGPIPKLINTRPVLDRFQDCCKTVFWGLFFVLICWHPASDALFSYSTFIFNSNITE